MLIVEYEPGNSESQAQAIIAAMDAVDQGEKAIVCPKGTINQVWDMGLFACVISAVMAVSFLAGWMTAIHVGR